MTCGDWCNGCYACMDEDPEERENDHQQAQRKKREEDALRAQGKPTLHVSLGSLIEQHHLKRMALKKRMP